MISIIPRSEVAKDLINCWKSHMAIPLSELAKLRMEYWLFSYFFRWNMVISTVHVWISHTGSQGKPTVGEARHRSSPHNRLNGLLASETVEFCLDLFMFSRESSDSHLKNRYIFPQPCKFWDFQEIGLTTTVSFISLSLELPARCWVTKELTYNQHKPLYCMLNPPPISQSCVSVLLAFELQFSFTSFRNSLKTLKISKYLFYNLTQISFYKL